MNMYKHGFAARMAAGFLALQMAIGMIPVQAFAETGGTGPETAVVESAEAAADEENDAAESGSTSTEAAAAADEENETAESESTSAEAAVDEEKETGEPESSSAEDTSDTHNESEAEESAAEEKEQPGTNEPDPSETDDDAAPQKDASVETEITASSRTNNIIGEVFANQINMINAEGAEDIRSASLEKYPLEHHELDYYGDSERVRFVGSRNESEPDYLVYRDSFLLITEAESENYTVRISEDGDKAYISPAISGEQLSGKTGLVFLADEVKNDSILVFADEPEYRDDTLIVSIKSPEEMTVNELFSDGRLAFGEQQKKAVLKASTPIVTDPSGTNWSGNITSFKINDVSGTTDKDVFELYLTVGIHLEVEMDFDITTTGATGKKEYARIASINIPVELFDITVRYNMAVEFDDNPMHVKGTIKPSFNYLFGTIGVPTNHFRSPVTITELTLKNESSYNKDVKFYIGSQFQIQGGFLGLTIDFLDIDIGPVLSLDFDMAGGCYLTARHEKDLYGEDVHTGNVIHTCAFEGEKGCLELTVDERYSYRLYIKIDLFFDDWDFDVKSTLENPVSWSQYYNSYTYGSGFKEGICPHKFYKVPVNVYLDEVIHPAPAGISVTVSDALDLTDAERRLVSSTTDENGQARVYLPYKEKYRYTLLAYGNIEGQSLTGSGVQDSNIRYDEENRPVIILLHSDEKVTIKTNIVWNTDLEQNEVPGDGEDCLRLFLQRREAGTDKPWEDITVVDGDDYILAIAYTDKYKDWKIDDWVMPKFGFEGARAFLYEYRVRIVEPDSDKVITAENGEHYIIRFVEAYENAAGKQEESHDTKFYIENKDERAENVTTVTITGTAVMDIRLDKQWQIRDESTRPESVYLALLQAPEAGWADRANERSVPNEWVVSLSPIEGSASTLRSLQNEKVITSEDDLSSIEDYPLGIGKVSDENSWSVTYTVPLYRNGVKLQFMGAELDKGIIDDLLRVEYDLKAPVSVKSFGDYISVAGPAVTLNTILKSVSIINMDPPETGTITGTVRWERSAYWEDYMPRRVELHVYKNGEEIPETGESPLTLYTADHPGEEVWIWTLEIEGYDPDAEYTVKEVIPVETPDRSKDWVPESAGLHIYNYQTWTNVLECQAQALFEGEPSITSTSLRVYVKDKNTDAVAWTLDLKKDYGWWNWDTSADKNKVKSVSDYVLDAPDIAGYEKVYSEPFVTTGLGSGHIIYNYVVNYLRQSEHLNLHISKDWINTDDTTAYPDKVNVVVKRDGAVISTGELTRDGSGQWSSMVVSKDKDGNDLRRLDDAGRKYIYTIEEETVDGFTQDIVITEDTGDDIYYSLRNTWVGSDYVNVSGKVSWEGDEEHKQLRPDTVSITVVDNTEKYVRSIKIPTDGDGKFEAKYLPGKDSDGNALTYKVIESHVEGYTITYGEPKYDEKSRTWTCDVTNTLTGYFPLKIKKTVKGMPDDEDEIYKFNVKSVKTQESDSSSTRESPLPTNADELKVKGAGEITADFLLDENGLYFYLLSEEKGADEKCSYDEKKYVVLITRTTGEDGKPVFTSYVKETPEDISQINSELYFDEDSDHDDDDDREKMDKLKSDTVEFINSYPNISVQKNWDIDIEGFDRPDSIEVVVQKNNNGSWENVRLLELSSKNDWRESIFFEDDPNREGQYRVRELKEESVLASFISGLRKEISGGSSDVFSSVWNSVKESQYYSALPGNIRTAGDQGADSLKKELGAETEELYDKLIEQIGLTTAAGRIIYDKDDADKDDGTTNQVAYHVGGYVSAVSGSVDAHETKYKVSYGSGDNGIYTVTNKAILEIDIVKRWFSFGADSEDTPDSAWLVLLAAPKEGAISNAADIAEAAGIDLGGLVDYELPVIDPIEGGADPISIISELALGMDINIFSGLGIIPKLAIAKAEKNDDSSKSWRVHFVDSKYHLGIPMEYKGAELSSEIIRQAVKYITKLDLPVSYNPFDKYISIIGKAKEKLRGFSLDDFDLSKLISIGKQLTEDDLDLMDLPSAFTSDTDLAANVINVKIDGDSDDDDDPDSDKLSGKKIWAGDSEENRPDFIKIHVKDGGSEVEGSPITLNKSSFGGEDTWNWELKLPEDADEDAVYIVSEEWPENYAYKDHYVCTRDGLDMTNTWKEEVPETVSISGLVAWKDKGDQDGIRPQKTVLYLLADGKRVLDKDGNDICAETSGAGGWKFFFSEQPRKNEQGETITYTVEEQTTDVITGTDAPGTYAYVISGEQYFTVINTHTPETVTLSGAKTWDDNDDRDGERPDSITVHLRADGEEAYSKTVTAEDDWSWTFEDLPKYKDGKEISYILTEDLIDDYTQDIDGMNVTNKHTPGKTQVNVYKWWDDADDLDGVRPKSVTVHLHADGTDTDLALTLNEENGWSGSFTDIDKMKAGKEIVYTVSEDPVKDYDSTISGSAADGFTIKNTHIPEHDTDETEYTITYKLNGGSYNGSTADIIEKYTGGTTISIHEKPIREGYSFLYWQGSSYQPGDKYVVNADHTFTAQWKKDENPPTDPTDPTDPKKDPQKDPTIKPTQGHDVKSSDTGDEAHIGLWLAITSASSIILLWLFTSRYFHKKK